MNNKEIEKMVVELTRKYHPQDLGEPTSILENAMREALTLAHSKGVEEERGRIKKDYIKWIFSNSYGRKYDGQTPFTEWKTEADAEDMSNWD